MSSPDGHRAAPVHQSDSALACSSAPHPSDPQPPNLSTKRKKTDIPTLLSADILALRPQKYYADQTLWNVGVHSCLNQQTFGPATPDYFASRLVKSSVAL